VQREKFGRVETVTAPGVHHSPLAARAARNARRMARTEKDGDARQRGAPLLLGRPGAARAGPTSPGEGRAIATVVHKSLARARARMARA
jgi:hypothetical protein